MLIKKTKLVIYAFVAFLFVGLSPSATKAQEAQGSISFQNKIESLTSKFSNVRFSSVSYYKLSDKEVKSLKGVIKEKLGIGQQVLSPTTPSEQQGSTSARIDSLVDVMKDNMHGRRISEVEDLFYNDPQYAWMSPTGEEIEKAFNIAFPRGTNVDKTDINDMFIITTQPTSPNEVPQIIALVLYTDQENLSKETMEENFALINYYNSVLGNSLANERDVLTNPELMNFVMPDESTLYEKLVNEYRQGNFVPITAEVRGIGTELTFFNTYGKSKSLLSNENDITGQDVQKFLRVSDGQPIDYIKQNEIIVSPDLISYRRYNIEYYETEDENGIVTLEPYGFANANLPSYGVEVKFGLDEINYPSFYSERMMLRAIWDNVKLGLVLPTNGWSSLTKDLFSVDRRFTYAGVGLSAALDFPIKVIPQSGVFSISGSYVFGDAHEASYKDRDKYYELNDFAYNPDDLLFNDYIVRYTAQAHYTFGFSIDESYQLRFGIGASVYGTELWHDYEELNEFEEMVIKYKQAEDETVGGISLRAEFMSVDASTPFGASLQYFDESLYADAWLQIPILTNTLFARVDAKGYVAAFKNDLHPWENKSVFIPSIRLIYNF
ncbi:MAG: hypothetical protein LBO69_08095 [Ignavibacteria bacterium]|jgi:hypothetical protein|nr:hypothetical protein [Ignavibacteria bacterium]